MSQRQHLARAKQSLRALLEDPSIPPAVRQTLAPEFDELALWLEKLEQDRIHVAVFGRVSVGKSALLNALLGAERFPVDALHGTTRSAEHARWSALDGAVELIDTPGIDELDGEARERLAHEVAERADLVLFVVEGDLSASEMSALDRLLATRRPLLLVLNKADRYDATERAALLARLRARTHGRVRASDVVAVAAAPRHPRAGSIAGGERPGPVPEIEALRARMVEVLAEEGRTLAAINAALFAGRVSDQLGRKVQEARAALAERLIRHYALAKGVAVGLNPLPLADLIAAAGIDVVLVLHLGRVYGLELTRVEAGELVAKIGAQVLGLMSAIWGVHLAASGLKGLSAGLSTGLTAGAQGALAYFATLLTGRAAKSYLVHGKSWGIHGPKRVVEEILASLDRDSILRDARAEILARLDGRRPRSSAEP